MICHAGGWLEGLTYGGQIAMRVEKVVAVEALVVLRPLVLSQVPFLMELCLATFAAVQAVRLSAVLLQESRIAGIVIANGA